MPTFRIRFHGPASLALDVVTALADADGVELTSSEPPNALESGEVSLDVRAEGATIAVSGAVDRVRETLPVGATIDVIEP